MQGTWPIVADALDTHRVAQDFPIGMSFGGSEKHFNIDGRVYVGATYDFCCFRFWSLDLDNAGDHKSLRGSFLVRMVLHFYLERFFGGEDPSLIL